jgi:hypothetical protein
MTRNTNSAEDPRLETMQPASNKALFNEINQKTADHSQQKIPCNS